MLNNGVTFNHSSVKCVHLPHLRHISLITKIYRLQLIAADYYISFYLIVLLTLACILQLINLTAS